MYVAKRFANKLAGPESDVPGIETFGMLIDEIEMPRLLEIAANPGFGCGKDSEMSLREAVASPHTQGFRAGAGVKTCCSCSASRTKAHPARCRRWIV